VITSILSFGLLALSTTPMVNAFGVTLSLGCFLNLLFAPLVGNLKSGHENTTSGNNSLNSPNADPSAL
jgi:predicted exporter